MVFSIRRRNDRNERNDMRFNGVNQNINLALAYTRYVNLVTK